jgi:hypothetical protein
MKVGDLVRITQQTCSPQDEGKIGVVLRFAILEPRGPQIPVILLNGKALIYGSRALEVISEYR